MNSHLQLLQKHVMGAPDLQGRLLHQNSCALSSQAAAKRAGHVHVLLCTPIAPGGCVMKDGMSVWRYLAVSPKLHQELHHAHVAALTRPVQRRPSHAALHITGSHSPRGVCFSSISNRCALLVDLPTSTQQRGGRMCRRVFKLGELRKNL